MIQLTRLNREPLVVNSDLIEVIECRPDTTIALTTGQKILVLEPLDEVVRRVIEFRRLTAKCTVPSFRQPEEEASEAETSFSASWRAISLKA
jgi:flagellar protein FlbD